MQENRAVGCFPGESHLVGHDDHGPAFPGKVPHHAQHLADQFRVERRGRLVEQQHLGLHGQRPGDRDALLLAAGKLRGIAVVLVFQANLFQQRHGFLACGGLAAFQHPDRPFGNVLHHRHMGPEIEALEHHAEFGAEPDDPSPVDAGGPAGAVGADQEFFPIENDPAAVRNFQKVEATEQGALARSGTADDRDDLAGRRGQRHTPQDRDVAEALVNVLGDQGRCGANIELPG